jgi:DNA-binding NtrC family response regulator
LRPAPLAAERRLHLLVVEGETSSRFALPGEGLVVIGRGPEADLELSDPSVSRKHARVLVSGDEVRIVDLDSHNGTLVNGEPVNTRVLASGDVVSICSVMLVLRCAGAPVRQPTLVDSRQLHLRLDEELERALRSQRSLSLAAIMLPAPVDRDAVRQCVANVLRLTDVPALSIETQLLVLFPELDEEKARNSVEQLLAALPGAHGGLATYPGDGCDRDTLLAAARVAAGAAKPGEVVSASITAATLTIGEREIIVAEPVMLRLYELIRRLAACDLPVLILGETGAGKENAAFAVHAWSARVKHPFVTVNCAAIHESLVESELFGHERGAFSGAVATKMGLFENASGGTIFLDEVGELTPATQAKLLRVLETKRLTRIGDVREREINVRVVAATNRDLEQDVRVGRFRQDLFFRLNPATVVLPPLRERPREIPLLAQRFLKADCARAQRAELPLSVEAMQLLARYDWPGNVRELRNTMAYLAATLVEDRVEAWHLPPRMSGLPADAAESASSGAPPGVHFRPVADELRELERRRMSEALEAAGGVQRHAAELLGMPPRTFTMKYKQYGLKSR